jgi:hypothetical protein
MSLANLRSAPFSVWLTACVALGALGVSAFLVGSDPSTEALPSPVAQTVDSCVRPLLSVRDTLPALESAAFNPVMLAAAAQSTAAVARTASGDVTEPTATVLHELADRADGLAADPAGPGAAETVRQIAADADWAAAVCTDPNGPTRAITGYGDEGNDARPNDTGPNEDAPSTATTPQTITQQTTPTVPSP